MIELVPPNLAALGVKRRQGPPEADILTIWDTPYPVITRYKLLCDRLDIAPFAGGILRRQGSPLHRSYITSGYRDQIIGGNEWSAHLLALALDIAIGDIEAQIKAAMIAVSLFTRVGLYPDNDFIHVDLVNDAWIQKYQKSRYWVRRNGIYTPFSHIDSAIQFARSVA